MSQFDLTRRALLGAATSAVVVAAAPRAIARAVPVAGEFDKLPKLDELQSGHLRHFRNTLALPDGDWGTMISDDPLHVGDWTGYQYQLSGMAHGLAQAHFHRMPAAPGFFRTDMDRVVRKMLLPEVWQFWFSVSQGSPFFNPDQKEPRKPSWDPIARENIFYSGHLNHVAALYAYLFNDAKYDAPDAFVFHNMQAMGFGKQQVEYGLKSLNDAIYWQFVENGHLGVACQPNAVFLGCNQFPLWGLKWQDTRLGGTRADETVASHIAAWKRFGGFKPGQETPFFWFQEQNHLAHDDGKGFSLDEGPVMTAGNWSQWLMNATMPDYAKSVFDFVAAASLARDSDGSIVVVPPSQTGRPGQRFARGVDVLAGKPVPAIVKKSGKNLAYAGFWGWTALTLSERQDPRLAELLAYADRNMNPTWRDGGLYYPVHDASWEDGRFVGVTPTSGNVNFAYARLNVEDGLHKLYQSHWGAAHFAEPNLSDVSREVDVVRGRYLADRQALVVTVRPHRGAKGAMTMLEFANLTRTGQEWRLEIDGAVVANGNATALARTSIADTTFEAGKLRLTVPVERETTFVVRFA
ncbi:hypothetical protein WG901_21185 [Novosphingobium sp. PS1R-30]|uniref:Linalool dehydratase/isomerase domain-containing protein n=1 Tax=Novosphingobium anseongense TaxID=3133436 RepID=A0ABU8S1D9_9SPHN